MKPWKTESEPGKTESERAKDRAAHLYRLAFLMTGDRERSLQATLEAIDSEDAENSFFSSWLHAWSLRLVIAKALAGVRDELGASARRTASVRTEKLALPSKNLVFGADDMQDQIDRALLSIDIFPRCALLLTAFEGMSVEDAAILLDGDRDSVRKAQIIGLQELTRGLARMQGWTYSAHRSCGRTTEFQHA